MKLAPLISSFIALLAALGLYLTQAEAVPQITIQVVFVPGLNDIGRRGVLDLMRNARKISHRSGVQYKFRRIVTMTDPVPELATLETLPQYLEAWGHFLSITKILKPRVVTHVLLPPIWQNDKFWIYGYARKTCGYKQRQTSYSISSAMPYNQDGIARFNHSLVSFLHEISHELGAHHDDTGISIMHSNANQFTSQYWPFSWTRKSKNEIANCIS